MAQSPVVVLTLGVFDLFHIGHLRVLQNARALGQVLHVGLCSDAFVSATKGHAPVIPEDQRQAIVAAIVGVDATFLYDCDYAALDGRHWDVFAHGPDLSAATRDAVQARRRAARVVELPRHEGISTTRLRDALVPAIGVDLHDTLSHSPAFFRALFAVWPASHLYIVTGTPHHDRDATVQLLREQYGLGPHRYAGLLMGFDYAPDRMDADHFQRMARHKHQLLASHGISVYFDDNPFYVDYLRNKGVHVFQTVLSDAYLAHYRSKHPYFTCNLQRGQFQYLERFLAQTTSLPGRCDPELPAPGTPPADTADPSPGE